MRQAKELWLPFLVLALPCLIFAALLPYFPVDETRYLSVAWEMRLNHSFLVPLQNGLPYSHKPPLLFWLINLDWLIFGVNEWSLRFIPLGFSLVSVALVHRIGLLLWGEARIARDAALILSATWSYGLWSALIMFDVVLTSWVLLAVFGLVSAAREHTLKSWLLVALATGAGVLTKGPVFFVYVLPVALLSFLWMPKEKCSRSWYGWLTLSVLAGLALVLVWLVPAALTGGDEYRKAILWGQTVNRMAKSFAHQRPFWWYLPWLPVLLLPWILLPPTWRGLARSVRDPGSRLAVIWGVSTLVIFSFISGKQVHYLIPALPAVSLLMAKNLASGPGHQDTGRPRQTLPVFYCLLGAIAFALPFSKLAKPLARAGLSGLHPLCFGLVALGVTLFILNRRAPSRLLCHTALSSVVLCAVVFTSDVAFFERYDLHAISSAIREKQEAGYSILHQGKYHGQYHFIGRLKEPLVPLENREEIIRYAASHEKVALISYEPGTKTIPAEQIYFQQPFRSKKVVLWNRTGIAALDTTAAGRHQGLQPLQQMAGKVAQITETDLHQRSGAQAWPSEPDRLTTALDATLAGREESFARRERVLRQPGP